MKPADLALYQDYATVHDSSPCLLRARDLIEAGGPREAVIQDLDRVIAGKCCGDSNEVDRTPQEAQVEAYVTRGDLQVLSAASIRPSTTTQCSARLSAIPVALRPEGDVSGLQRRPGRGPERPRERLSDEPWSPDALGHYGAAIALHASPTDPYSDFSRALGFLDLAIKRGIDNLENHAWRGLVRIFEDGIAGIVPALQDFRELCRLDPSFPSPHASCGVVLAWRGHLDAAIDEMRKAIEEDPRDARSLSYLGAALVLKGKSEEGLRRVNMAVNLNSRDARRSLSGAPCLP